PLVHFWLGRVLVERGGKEEGGQALNTALRLALAQENPGVSLPDIYYNLARAYYSEGQYDRALAAAQAVKRADPHYPEIYYLSGKIFYAQYQMALAQIEFEREIQENPRHAGSYFYLSFCYDLAGQSDKAIAALLQAAELNPLDKSVLGRLGYYKNLIGETAQAVHYYQQALRLDPWDVSVRQQLAGVYYQRRQYDLAAEQLERSLELYPENWPAASLLAACYRATNNPAAARAVLKKAKRFSPWSVVAYFLCLGLPAGITALRGRRLLKKIKDGHDPEERIRQYHAFRKWSGRILGAGIFAQVTLYYALHLDYIGMAYGIKHFSLLTEALSILFLFASAQVVFILVDRAVRQTRAGIWEYLRIYLGMLFLLALQWIAIVAMVTAVSRKAWHPGVLMAALAGLAAAVYGYTAVFPRLMKFFFKHHPCPADTEASLQKVCERVGLALEAIPVLQTSGIKMANAAATGLKRGNYYVYLTSYLLEVLSPPELEAIFLHECGHLKMDHIRVQAHLLFAFLAVIVWLSQVSTLFWGGASLFLPAGVLLVYMAARSWLSRKQERETDEFAVDHSEDPSALFRALEKLY
ncbi:MAG: tetratricopeptide repeat protein, partial [Candidatus Omnitrophota bacterium]